MIKRILMYIVLIVIFGGSMLVLSKYAAEDTDGTEENGLVKEEVIKRVRVMEIQPRAFEETITVPGSVEAFADVMMAAAIPGVVEKVNVKEGDFVKKGQELFQIDLRTRNAIKQEAQAVHELAMKTLKRTEALYKRGDVAVQELDEAQAAEVQAAASLRRLDVEISLGHVNAPIDGYIDKVEVNEGEYVHDGSVMALLLSLNQVKISVGVPEKFADAVSGEAEALVLIEALGEKRNAKIDRLAYGADPQTKTFEATLILDNKDLRIRPGMIVRTQFVTARNPNALMVPLFSLVKNDSGMRLFVEKDGVVESRPVQIGGIDGDFVEITNGIEENEAVVVIGQKDLVDKQKVDVMERITNTSQIIMTEAMP
jgi:membrane fusion protein, multidrug efflux system